jgi:DNA-binding transcriptional regulator LsrR (DeoR family)
MYHEQGLSQEEIAKRIGRTRSMVSRMLTEAERRKIVEVRVHRPRLTDTKMEGALSHQFNLKDVSVLLAAPGEPVHEVRRRIGVEGARMLGQHLANNLVIGTGWGTSVGAVVQELAGREPLSIKVVQLVAALGSRNLDYDGHASVRRLVERIGGEGYYLHAPFMVENSALVQELFRNPSVRETVELFRKCDVAITGLGSTDPRFCSYFQAGYVPLEALGALRSAGAVGDVCGHHYDINGKAVAAEFDQRLVAIPRDDFVAIPTRIGVAHGSEKAAAILGALRAGYLTALVTDSLTASQALSLARADGGR